MTPQKYEMDGIKLQSKEDFHTFTVQVCVQDRPQTVWTYVTIPKAISEFLTLQHRDLVEVSIRKLEKPK